MTDEQPRAELARATTHQHRGLSQATDCPNPPQSMSNRDTWPHHDQREDSHQLVFEALRHPRRRHLVYVLAAAPEDRLSVRAAAHLIAVLEDGVDVTPKQVTNVRTSLKRSHQDPLEAAGIVAYEDTAIVPASQFTQALQTMAAGHSRPASPKPQP